MKKTILTSIIAMCMACPTYANIGKNESNPSCDNDTIGTTSGTTDLEADWDPNTINMEWYVDGAKITPDNPAANTCTYDGNVTLPTNTLSKTGYTFVGWAVVPKFVLSTLDASEPGIGYGYQNDSRTRFGAFSYWTDKYELTSDNTWATEFSYGTVKGKAICSAKIGYNHGWQWGGNSSDWTALESELISAGGQYCWCQATEFKGTNDSFYMSVASPAWVYKENYGNADNCMDKCAHYCAEYIQNRSAYRSALFGISQ